MILMSKREDEGKQHDSNLQRGNSEKQTASPLSSKSINTYTAPRTYGDTHYSKPYSSFLNTIACFIDDKKTVSKMYGIYLAQTKHIKKAYDQKTLLDTALCAIRTTFNATKSKVIKSVTGYFNGVLNKKLDDLYQQTLEEMWDESVDAINVVDHPTLLSICIES